MKKTYEEFCTYVEENILSRMSKDVKRSAYVGEVKKNNGIVLKGLTITRDGCNIAPTIYLEHYYVEYDMGYADLNMVLNEIAERYSYEEQKCPSDFEYSLLEETRIIGCLIGTLGNEDFLKDIPFIPVGEEFAIIFKYWIGECQGGMGTITITDSFAEKWGYDVERMLHFALENAPRLFPETITPMKRVLSNLGVEDLDFLLEDAEPIPMYVLSNPQNLFGAFAIFYEGVLDGLFKNIGEKLILLPSSVHEWMVVPYGRDDVVAEYTEMVQTVNESSLRSADVLGYRAYVVEKGKGSIFEQLATTYTYSR